MLNEKEQAFQELTDEQLDVVTGGAGAANPTGLVGGLLSGLVPTVGVSAPVALGVTTPIAGVQVGASPTVNIN
ncbi:MAG TPA: bacteriocin leader domain-containing protein [Ktedonobacteraceae bacterium]|jgi:hypothetical protein|nr:bacteriocin leader domain-containing protein [Ktedonobacteraceae bacterium]